MRINRYTVPAMLLAIIAVAFMNVLFALGTGVSLLIACLLVAAIGQPDWSRILSVSRRRSGGTHKAR